MPYRLGSEFPQHAIAGKTVFDFAANRAGFNRLGNGVSGVLVTALYIDAHRQFGYRYQRSF